MNSLEIFANALDFIEGNLHNDLKTQDVANSCFCSKSVLEKIFRCVSHHSVHEYVVKRRMTIAARMIATNKDVNILDVAVDLGYSTNEAFSRAFKSIWNCNPSEFKNKKDIFQLFPRFYPPIQDGGIYMSERRHVDVSEMYDLFLQRKDCYFICCDIKAMEPINEISRKAGDLAILEAMNRMNHEAGYEDIVFRIGGDEFVMLTNCTNKEEALDICERIKSHNGQTFSFEDKDIPLHLHCGIFKFEGRTLRYRDLYDQLHFAILDTK